MSIAGKTLKNSRRLYREKAGGFTLIELIIVIFIAGLMLSITVPVVRETLLHDNLKTTSRKLVATITWLRNKSVGEYKDYALLFDLGEGKYWPETSGMSEGEILEIKDQAYSLPEDVRILDIDLYGSEKKIDGQLKIKFSKKGYICYSLIHLGDKGDRKFTLVLEPFLGKVKIMEDYLSFEDVAEKDI
ncbi:MAG: prepilin-type N-terminal cleavage/methylation domain-containing protein [Desulfobacteraceae bacterium]|jgi:prepilin-type N-terminal cleavage/methylation domain-containing protein